MLRKWAFGFSAVISIFSSPINSAEKASIGSDELTEYVNQVIQDPVLKRVRQFHSLMHDASESWLTNQYLSLRTGYDTNINIAPSHGPLAKVGKDGTYNLNYDLNFFKLLHETSINVDFSGYYSGYMKHKKLNSGSLIASGKVANYFHDKVIGGGLLYVMRHWQPRKFDITLQSQSTSFTHWNVSFSPFVSFFPKDGWALDGTYKYSFEDYSKSKVPGEYPFSARVQNIKLAAEYLQNEECTLGASFDWHYKRYTKFPAFSVAPDGTGVINTQGIKLKTRDLKGSVDITYELTPNVTFFAEYDFGKSKDMFQGFETYRFYGPVIEAQYQTLIFQKPYKLDLKGSFEKRDYQEQGSESEFKKQGVLTLLKYKTYVAEAMETWKLSQAWDFYDKLMYERRSTNETLSQANRSYTRWIFEVGVLHAF